jgi:GH15 family glucan-1,4-alpha-glucosidase
MAGVDAQDGTMTIQRDMAVTSSRVSLPGADQQPPVGGVDGEVEKNRAAGTGVFPGIADYAFLSDCETNCLIAPSGSVEWMCLPRPDSPSVFTTMLDRGAGSFRVAPFGVAVPTARRYLPGTLVLETTWQTPTGWLVVRDALIMAGWHNTKERSRTHRRTPTDEDAAHCLLRTISCVNGAVDVSVTCEPVFDDARRAARWRYPTDGYTEVVATVKGQPRLRLTGSVRFGVEGRAVIARTRMTRGQVHHVALTFSELPAPADTGEALDWMEGTGEYWRQWLTQGRFPDHPWRGYLQSSALALKGLSYAPTGALLAAATTSLPQAPAGHRNRDHRYTFVRDAAFALWGLYTLGFDREANDFFAFIRDTCQGNPNDLRAVSDVDGRPPPPATVLDHLTGYRDCRPVRVGDDTGTHRHVDSSGALLDAIYLHVRTRDQLPEDLWPIVTAQVEQAVAHWSDPDHGFWDIPGEPRHYTASKMLCWVAVDRGARLARLHDAPGTAAAWQQVADQIHADILANGVDKDGVFTLRYGGDELDAALLLAPLFRFLPPGDPRIRGTVLAIVDRLGVHGLPRRYQTDAGDPAADQEHPFLLCSYWLVSALTEIGETTRARALCERLLAHASTLGLYAEALDPVTGRHLGNYPQALTHLALINAVTHLIRTEQAGHTHRFTPANQRTR